MGFCFFNLFAVTFSSFYWVSVLSQSLRAPSLLAFTECLYWASLSGLPGYKLLLSVCIEPVSQGSQVTSFYWVSVLSQSLRAPRLLAFTECVYWASLSGLPGSSASTSHSFPRCPRQPVWLWAETLALRWTWRMTASVITGKIGRPSDRQTDTEDMHPSTHMLLKGNHHALPFSNITEHTCSNKNHGIRCNHCNINSVSMINWGEVGPFLQIQQIQQIWRTNPGPMTLMVQI